jgi:hypothetical protein
MRTDGIRFSRLCQGDALDCLREGESQHLPAREKLWSAVPCQFFPPPCGHHHKPILKPGQAAKEMVKMMCVH